MTDTRKVLRQKIMSTYIGTDRYKIHHFALYKKEEYKKVALNNFYLNKRF